MICRAGIGITIHPHSIVQYGGYCGGQLFLREQYFFLCGATECAQTSAHSRLRTPESRPKIGGYPGFRFDYRSSLSSTMMWVVPQAAFAPGKVFLMWDTRVRTPEPGPKIISCAAIGMNTDRCSLAQSRVGYCPWQLFPREQYFFM